MYQTQLNDQIAQTQAKAVEKAKHLAQVAVESAQELSEINQAAAKDAMVAAQDASTQFLAIKDAQQFTKLAQPEVAQVIDASIDDARDDLVKFVKESTKTAPAGSEAFVSAFNTAFEASIQQFDQIRATATDTFANFEKSVDAAMVNIQGQYASKSAKKSAAKLAA